MKPNHKSIFIVSADPVVRQQCIRELASRGGGFDLPAAGSVEQARRAFLRTHPSAIFLDESSTGCEGSSPSLEAAVALLTETAPVVVAAAEGRQGELAFLIASGTVDFVAHGNQFASVAAGLLERRVRLAEQAGKTIPFPVPKRAADFGEILRHEVNNPLTGILGNTELLLARRDRLPPAAIERLKVIAELAVRLRETVRRLSNTWEEIHEHVHQF